MGNDGALPGNYLAGGAAGRSHGHVIIKTSSILHPTTSARLQIVRCEDSCSAPKPSASPNLEPRTVGVGSAHLAPPGEPLLGGAGGVLREISRRRRSVSVRHGTAGAGGVSR